MLRKIAVLLSLLAVSGCAAAPGYQAAMLMKQQRAWSIRSGGKIPSVS